MDILENDINKAYKIITKNSEIIFDDELDLIFDILTNVVNGKCFLVYEILNFKIDEKIYEYSYDVSNQFIRMFREFIFQNILEREFTRIEKEAS